MGTVVISYIRLEHNKPSCNGPSNWGDVELVKEMVLL
jgi:hypothetical protein